MEQSASFGFVRQALLASANGNREQRSRRFDSGVEQGQDCLEGWWRQSEPKPGSFIGEFDP